ncbi:homologous recombination OB-fold protein isoform X2 [Mixophyes fleayi]|uniref:homologous recombination OB-fold protein isoform X2 n=1 Tax=Mixophyes fleayi TaxID=3061075 RepID=UPI003F4DA466
MALSLHNLFCSGSEDFDDEDFLSVLEDTEPSLPLPKPTTAHLRPISKIPTKDSEEPGNYTHDTKPSPAQLETIVQVDVKSTEATSAPSLVQDVDDEELLSVFSELEAEVSEGQCQAPKPQLLLRPTNQTSAKNSADSNNSSFQLRPSRSSLCQDLETRQCSMSIPPQPQYYNCNASSPPASSFQLSDVGSGPCHSSEPTAKRPCLRPTVETQPVTPVRVGTLPYPSLSTHSRGNIPASASGTANTWQNPVNRTHSLPRTPLSSPRPHPPSTLQTPVVTNHLLQLMTAANKTPRKMSWETPSPKERRFPGPAGLLPDQSSGRGLDEILVSNPHTPNHGARAKIFSKEGMSSQQPMAEEFIRGPWATMKADLSLDENDPTCFLRTYSVVMVLRKAALKQLPRNKVPRMAVALKSLTPANGDASAVFRDPTGDIQGTVHHVLLEERESELKIGNVLLLQQVGVFSPSHRNHYLNVTPSNIVKIYPLVEEGGTSRVPVSLSHVELDVNSNQAQSADHLSPSAFQPAASHPSSSTAQLRIHQPAASHPSSSTAQPRMHQSAASHPSSSTAQPRIHQPAAFHPSSSTAQPRIHQPAAFHPLSSTAQPMIQQPAAFHPLSSTAQPMIQQPAAFHPSSSTAQPRIQQPATYCPSSSIPQPQISYPAAAGDWDMDDLDCLLRDLPEDPDH